MSAISAASICKCPGVSVARSDGSDVSGALQSIPMMDPQPLGAKALSAEVLEAAN